MRLIHLFILCAFTLSLIECGVLDELNEIIRQSEERTCRYTRYGIDKSHCKNYPSNKPFYPGLGYHPLVWNRFRLPLYEPVHSPLTVMDVVNRKSIGNICKSDGFMILFSRMMDGTNHFWDISLSEFDELFGKLIGSICSISSEMYSLIPVYGRQLDEYFIKALRLLPEEYNGDIYNRFFDAFGCFVAMGSYGGTWTEGYEIYDVENTKWVRISGGNETLRDKKKWIESIINNPTMTDFEIVRMSELVSASVKEKVLQNIISYENSIISNRPNATTFREIRTKRKPCKLVTIRDLVIVIMNSEYQCGSAKFKWYYKYYAYTNGFIPPEAYPICANGEKGTILNFSHKVIESCALAVDERRFPFVESIMYGWSRYEAVPGREFVGEQVLDAPVMLTNEGVRGTNNDTINYFSMDQFPGMVRLNKFSCPSPNLWNEWGELVLAGETHSGCSKIGSRFGYVYPYGTGATPQTLGEPRQFCAPIA